MHPRLWSTHTQSLLQSLKLAWPIRFLAQNWGQSLVLKKESCPPWAKNKSPEKVNRHRTHIFHGQADIDDPSTYRRLNSWGSTLRSRYISLAVRFGRTKHTNCDAPLLNRPEGTNEAGLSGSLRVSGGRCVWWWWAGVQSKPSRAGETSRVEQDTESISCDGVDKNPFA